MYKFFCMNTNIQAFDLPENTHSKVEKLFRKSEQTLSRFHSSSELSQLNHSFQVPFICSPILFEAVKVAHLYYEKTSGLFNPYLGKQISSIGYDRSFEKIKPININSERLCRLQEKKKDIISFHAGMKCITIQDSVYIDLGGIAKGWTAQCIKEVLKQDGYKSGVLVAGGDIVAWGKKQKIHLEHPGDKHASICSFELTRDAGIATSSIIKRRWHSLEGITYHHILDPRTSQPCHSDLQQVSVMAPTLTEAEVLAKCMLILGWQDGLSMLNKFQKQKPLAAIALTKRGEIVSDGDLSYFIKGGSLVC
ncbi:FAD:protein FMN transferase [Niallia sp. NCCP-28]|uniref:FAD:protein FMN transferase n=1 Tax=Niallia sp. NCCP-28 TaxID=2934712 RepID=UPI002081E410|nr:FAD:protein FMN transferase [Niallia sp. NCCP-28]GKU83656.1 FAD:protein FMN transferase [Niallia sp. NCCP-28]